jgi:phosphoserine phosphatase
MRFGVTLITDPALPGLDEARVASLASALAAAGAVAAAPDWLAPGVACDLPFDGPAGILPGGVLEAAALRGCLGGTAIDMAVQPAAGRRKVLLIADLESTIIGQEMLDEMAELAGLGERVIPITARAMAGELDFATALRKRVRLLENQPAHLLEQASGRMTLTAGARTLVQTMAAHGAYCALVSGGFSYFADQVASACGFHEAQANRLDVTDGRLTGQVDEPLLDREAKLDCLNRLAAVRGLDLASCCAVGDGANDAAMLGAAGLGVAYRGKPPARAAARSSIDHGDLTALLYLQGYRRSEFRD